jgi:hypothetical protein
MHSLHGVPPGSSAQVPASTATPQWPLVQVSPTQHCAALAQLDPGGRQLPPPQMEPWHTAEQHSAAVMQAKPSSVQALLPHTSLSQSTLQQSLARVHAEPSGMHEVEPQTPGGSQVAVQQSLSTMHA